LIYLIFFILALIVKYSAVTVLLYRQLELLLTIKESIRESVFLILGTVFAGVLKDVPVFLFLFWNYSDSLAFVIDIVLFLEAIGWLLIYYYFYKA